MLSPKEILEVKSFIKKLRKEGSTTAGVGGFATPNAFVGSSSASGSAKATGADKTYTIKPSKKKRHFVKLSEASYKEFKQDDSLSEVQKINQRILAANRMLREVSRALDHSLKLKQESAVDNSAYWKRTNESILKMVKRVSEVRGKVASLANIKELAAGSVKDKLAKLLTKAGLQVVSANISHNRLGNELYEFDIYINGEPIAIDYNNGDLIYQDVDKEVYLGNINQNEQALIANINKVLK